MQKAQGALEYLIIIAAVLAISAVVVMFVTGAAGTGKSEALYGACQSAAAECKLLQKANPSNPCVICEESCADPISAQYSAVRKAAQPTFM
jgi:hypothetical protein